MSDVDLAPGTPCDSGGQLLPEGAESDYVIGQYGGVDFVGKTPGRYEPVPQQQGPQAAPTQPAKAKPAAVDSNEAAAEEPGPAKKATKATKAARLKGKG